MTKDIRVKLVKELEETLNINEILDDLLVAISEYCSPEDVFDTDELERWAEENDYKKEFVDPDVD